MSPLAPGGLSSFLPDRDRPSAGALWLMVNKKISEHIQHKLLSDYKGI
jgi:hypothetical protein